jgi:uncharacterized protein RhaS with RHS repeats
VGGVTYTWDDNGNLLNDGVNTYTYDATNRLTAVSGPALSTSYGYNGLGDHLQQTVDSVTTNHTLDLAVGLTQVLEDGSNTYMYGLGRIGEQQTGGFVMHLGDALGSVCQVRDATGEIVLAKDYEPYGEIMNSTGIGVSNYAFSGEWADSTGMLYLRSRY